MYDNHACSLLDKLCITRTSFEEMTGTTHPWEVTNGAYSSIQKQFDLIENDIQAANTNGPITCVKTQEGAFWLNSDGIDSLLDSLDKPLEILTRQGPSPLWRYTSAELFSQHLENLRRLIISATHDKCFLNRIKNRLPADYDNLANEINKIIKQLDDLLKQIKNDAPQVQVASDNDIYLYERARITFDLLQHRVVNEASLGYDRQTLQRAFEILEQRCGGKVANLRQRIQALFLMFRDEVRQSEILQLILAGRWDISLAHLGKNANGLSDLVRLTRKEVQGLSAMVQSREDEIGPSPAGANALALAEKAEEEMEHAGLVTEDMAGQALTDEEIQKLLSSAPSPGDDSPETQPDAQSQRSKQKSSTRRMAFTSGGARGRR